MPPLRRASSAIKHTVKQPAKSERTHEENQERAYIAASRRSDRSIEARVESARRASEIHKQRTGRSLKVTEKDVENEEMYEEEDDDLPMRYQRFNALHPGQPVSAFYDRINMYMDGQLGMRSALHEAIYNARMHTERQQHLNRLMQQSPQNGGAGPMAPFSQNMTQPPWSPNQMAPPEQTMRTESFSYSPIKQEDQSPTFTMPDARSMSFSLPSPGSRRSASASQPPQSSNQSSAQVPTSRQPGSPFDTSDPFSSTLPANQQQLLDGNPSFSRGVHPSQMTPSVPMPSTYQYQFDPHSKVNNTPGSEQFAFGRRDLNQTLAPQNLQSMQFSQLSSAPNMATEMEFGHDLAADVSWAIDDNSLFNFDQATTGQIDFNGQVTPGDSAWSPEDFVNFNPTST